MIVTVVTRGLSDDCNSVTVIGDTVYLQVARIGSTYVFYYSMDGAAWQMVRTFSLETQGTVAIGFESQSPVGTGSTAEFSQMVYSPKKIANVYKGE